MTRQCDALGKLDAQLADPAAGESRRATRRGGERDPARGGDEGAPKPTGPRAGRGSPPKLRRPRRSVDGELAGVAHPEQTASARRPGSTLINATLGRPPIRWAAQISACSSSPIWRVACALVVRLALRSSPGMYSATPVSVTTRSRPTESSKLKRIAMGMARLVCGHRARDRGDQREGLRRQANVARSLQHPCRAGPAASTPSPAA